MAEEYNSIYTGEQIDAAIQRVLTNTWASESYVATLFNNLESIINSQHWKGTQAEYDVLATHDSSTIYFITGNSDSSNNTNDGNDDDDGYIHIIDYE